MIHASARKILSSTSKKSFSSIKIKLPKYEVHKMKVSELPTEYTTNDKEVLNFYKQMYLMRRMEITIDGSYKNQEIRGFCHLYDGQEAVIAGIEDVVNFDDCLITGYRDHCHALTRGDTPKQIIAEMLGRITGSTKGKGGSMHYYRKATNWYGGNGIVGAQSPIGTGLAFGLKYKKKENCAVIMYGDGAANQGQLFEAFNIAYLWKLPCIYICENNNYAMGTPVERAASNPNFYQRGDVIPGIKLDGQNIFSVKAGMQYARKYSIEHGPIIVEANTYRYRGHSMSDPGTAYRTMEEVQEVRKSRDPIEYLKSIIMANNLLSEEEIKKIEGDIRAEITEAYESAKKDPFPSEKDLFTDVYVDNDKHFFRGIEYQDSILPAGDKTLY